MPPEPRPTVVVVEGAAGLAPHAAAWEALAADALEPNPFYEPWMLLPAVEAFGGGKPLLFVLVFTPDPKQPHGPPLLSGFFPLERRRRYKGLPVRSLGLWQHLYCFLGTPLLRAGQARAALAAFLDWLATDPRGSGLMEFSLIGADGPFHQLLIDLFNERGTLTHVAECFNRALYRPRGDADSYLHAALSGKRRKELKRQENRLGEAGTLEYAVLAPGDAAASWVADFLCLEAGGWKGQEGTALGAKDADRRFFETVAGAAFRRGRLMLLALRLDGRPIAMKCNFLAPPGSFAFKIAFDEDYARYSPGVHLELANMTRMRDRPGVEWMDSCAVAEHFMINRLWLERRTIASVLAATGRAPGELVVSLLPLLKWVKRKVNRRRN